ncbi:1-deoxy-D-xylulose-5-phosphate synthase [Endozoicomonas sp. OPT23]|uniref:1-deoxy-D-xylulose-5-phosphate synthase n=1 Tax=Endozoicomonas sp. OPT23 TaxID=2072845 RepID=UPI00129AC68C|nr:1-deoxy-D-xylulose-5-phosphate synthase [Endozoicomonas sp. OPT23]MRI32786.1 1-deoxy-D-xylulose-5-phosphate synthase [Endozoicomonas sp. OPT23]
MFHEIPKTRPATPLLDRADIPEQLRQLDASQLPELANELREYLLYSVGQVGGHFGAGLGVVELTIALHYLFETPRDRIVWDVGHQAYPHKILTGRKEQMNTLRQKDGLAAFPKRAESEYDTFGVGHSSTSISAALGMAAAAKLKGEKRRTVAVIGDGSLTAGMAYEAMNHAADLKANMLVILNDNDMSISNSVGGLSNYLTKVLSSKTYHHIREGSKKVLNVIPHAWELARRTEEHMKGMVIPGTLFEEMGFNYFGPIDGHDLPMLLHTIENLKDLEGPQFLHIVTRKGKGFAPAEQDPIGYHAITKLEPKTKEGNEKPKLPKKPKYCNIFGEWLYDMAAKDQKLVGITPAMREGSDMIRFSEHFPDRYFDVAIAEQHAVTLAAGMACEGTKPVVAIYSTFLQRAYDQLVHDVAVQKLDVLFAIDRAGMVGEDGPTHGGCYDIAYLRCIPEMLVMAPADEDETRRMLTTGYQYNGPASVRYPRGTGPGAEISKELTAMEIGKGEVRRSGKRVAILAFGTVLQSALDAGEQLDVTVANMRFVKPLDTKLVAKLAQEHELLVTVEEGCIAGGAGSAVAEYLSEQGLNTPTMHLGIPDEYIEGASHSQQLAQCGLDAAGIQKSIEGRLKGSFEVKTIIQHEVNESTEEKAASSS